MQAGLPWTWCSALAADSGSNEMRSLTQTLWLKLLEHFGSSLILPLLALLMAMCGCSVKKFAINKLGDSLASGGTNFASDDDPDLVGSELTDSEPRPAWTLGRGLSVPQRRSIGFVRRWQTLWQLPEPRRGS